MPTILIILGWRLFFYANEGNEPIHVHCRKGEMECEYWLNRNNFDLEEAFAFNMSLRDNRQIQKLFMNILNILSNSGMIFSRGANNEKIP
jgi:hypothetical protein